MHDQDVLCLRNKEYYRVRGEYSFCEHDLDFALACKNKHWLSAAISILFFPELWETPDINGFPFAMKKRNESEPIKLFHVLNFPLW